MVKWVLFNGYIVSTVKVHKNGGLIVHLKLLFDRQINLKIKKAKGCRYTEICFSIPTHDSNIQIFIRSQLTNLFDSSITLKVTQPLHMS